MRNTLLSPPAPPRPSSASARKSSVRSPAQWPSASPQQWRGKPPLPPSSSPRPKTASIAWQLLSRHETPRYDASRPGQAMSICPMTMNSTMGKLMPQSPPSKEGASSQNGSKFWGVERSSREWEKKRTKQNMWSHSASQPITHEENSTPCPTGARSSSSLQGPPSSL